MIFIRNHKLKGKQVQVLYDLVTVNRECKVMRGCAATGEPGRRLFMC